MRRTLREQLKFIGEHTLVIIVALFASLIIAISALVGIYVLNFVGGRLSGANNPLVESLVNYSGIEAIVIFVLASLSLIRYLFSQDRER